MQNVGMGGARVALLYGIKNPLPPHDSPETIGSKELGSFSIGVFSDIVLRLNNTY